MYDFFAMYEEKVNYKAKVNVFKSVSKLLLRLKVSSGFSSFEESRPILQPLSVKICS